MVVDEGTSADGLNTPAPTGPAVLLFFKRPEAPGLLPPPTAKDLEGTGLYL
jgi:hypothetical protein